MLKISLSQLMRWAGRILFGMMFLWGTFAALVAFAVRYEIGMFAPPEIESEQVAHTTAEPAFTRPKVTGGDWNRLLGPDAIERAFRAAAQGHVGDAGDTLPFNRDRLSLTLQYEPTDSSAVWNAVYRIGCDCTYVTPEEAPRYEASIDPLSGAVLSFNGPEANAIPNTGDTLTGHTGEEVRP